MTFQYTLSPPFGTNGYIETAKIQGLTLIQFSPAATASWQPGLPSPDNCVLSATNDALENICTLCGYNAAGNQITTTNALNQTSLAVYDGANRPFITVRNLVLGKAENGTVRLSAAEQIPFV